jgi:hypothetical protein
VRSLTPGWLLSDNELWILRKETQLVQRSYLNKMHSEGPLLSIDLFKEAEYSSSEEDLDI